LGYAGNTVLLYPNVGNCQRRFDVTEPEEVLNKAFPSELNIGLDPSIA